jgi:glycosyltransferase involved in cell wall biosynthesis
VQSVENQDDGGGVGAYEIIVVDDGSTDDGGDIVAEMAQNNPRIKLIRHPKNCGNGPARNTGLDAARGKYIYFVDADDVLVPNSMATNLDFMDCHNLEALHVKFVLTKAEDVNQIMSKVEQPPPTCSDVCTGIQYFIDTKLLTYEDHAVELWQVIFRLDVIKKNNVRSINGKSQDTMLHIEIMTNVQRMAWSNVQTYVYVEYRNSTCHQRYSYEKNMSMMLPLLEEISLVRKKYHDLYASNGLLKYLDVFRSGMCYVCLLWPMVRCCISPNVCRRDIAKLRELNAYPIGKPANVPVFDVRHNKIIYGLWLLSRHYHLWMALISVNYLFRKAPKVEAERVGR